MKISQKLFLFLCCCLIMNRLITIEVFAETILPSGLSLEEMEPEMEQYLSENKTANASAGVAVVNADHVLYESIHGPADEDTVYEWGSLTKTLTWIGIMQLEESGELNLSEDIRTYLPSGFLKKLTYDKKITLLDLMNHTAGFQDSITNVYTDEPTDILPLAVYLSRYEPPQIYEPGATVAYSNWGVTLAGYILERVSGETYPDYVKNHIFTPLGMEHTSIDPLRHDNSFVQEHLKQMTGYSTAGKEIPGQYYAPDYPAAGAAGTLQDAARFTQSLLSSQDCPLFQHPETLETMLTATRSFAGSEHPENAHGFWYDFYQTESLGHFGNTPQFSTHMSLSPKQQVGMIVLTNQSQETDLNMGLGNFVFGDYQVPKVSSDWSDIEFQDYYVGARTIEKGYCHFYNYFQIYQVQKTDSSHIELRSPFLKLPCVRTGEFSYLVDDGALKGYQFFVQTDDEQLVQKISTSTFDLLPYASTRMFADTLSFLLAGAALLLSLFIFLLCICRRLKKQPHWLIPCIISGLSLLFFILIPLEAGKLMTTAASTSDMIPFVIFDGFYLISGIAYLIYVIRTRQKGILDFIQLAAVLIIQFFILYWQMIFL